MIFHFQHLGLIMEVISAVIVTQPVAILRAAFWVHCSFPKLVSLITGFQTGHT